MKRESRLPVPSSGIISFRLGLIAIFFMFICYPISIAIAVAAIFQNQKAKRCAIESPSSFCVPSNVATFLGLIPIIVFPVVFFIPILIAPIPLLTFFYGMRNGARLASTISTMQNSVDDLVGEYYKLRSIKEPEIEITKKLELILLNKSKNTENSYNNHIPSFCFNISVVDGMSRTQGIEIAKIQSTTLGQCVFVIQFPKNARKDLNNLGFIVGAVKIKNKIHGSDIFLKVSELN